MDGLISETAGEGAFYLSVLVFSSFEENFLSFHFLKRLMHTASEGLHPNLWCHRDLLPGAAAWTTSQTLCRVIRCLLGLSRTDKLHFAVTHWDLSYVTEMCTVIPRKSSCVLSHASLSPRCLSVLSVIRGAQGVTSLAVEDNNDWQKTNSSGLC